jgi:hypothetical protein
MQSSANETGCHHLWGKSERAIFAIITSLLLPIFDSKLAIRQWGRIKVALRRHPPHLAVSSNDS